MLCRIFFFPFRADPIISRHELISNKITAFPRVRCEKIHVTPFMLRDLRSG